MFKTKIKKENENLKAINKTLNDEIRELKKKLEKYEEDRDNTLSGILKDLDYAIIVDHCKTKLFNNGRWEYNVKSIQFDHNFYTTTPNLIIEK